MKRVVRILREQRLEVSPFVWHEDGMTVHYRHQGSAIIVFGNTYPIRDQIKGLGGRFNGADKHWRLPASDEILQSIDTLCRSLGGGVLGDVVAIAVATTTTVQVSAGASVLERPDPAPGLSVRQLMDKLQLAVVGAFPQAVWVTGEIQNLGKKASGIFFDLAEGRAQGHANATITVRSILWGQTHQILQAKHGKDRLDEVLADGMQVRCLCLVQLYKDRGQVSLVVEDIDPSYTKGALALAREKLLKELRANGLDQTQKRLPLPPFPFVVGLVSAKGSRAESDFLDQLESLGFPGSVIFAPSAMQGVRVPSEVVRALDALVARDVDLIVLTRGGGSAADLRWFDAPELAYAIAQCPVPVIAAIGHHDDVSVTEEICHQRQKTPTAAADFVVARFAQTRDRIDLLAGSIAKLLTRRVDEFQQITSAVSERLAAAAGRALDAKLRLLDQLRHGFERSAESRISAAGLAFDQLRHGIGRAAETRLALLSLALAELEKRIIAKDPTPWLKDGWTQLWGKKGPLKKCADALVGETVQARLVDGRVGLTITTIEESTP